MTIPAEGEDRHNADTSRGQRQKEPEAVTSQSGLLVRKAALRATEPAVVALAGALRPEQLAGDPGAALLAHHPVDGLVPPWR